MDPRVTEFQCIMPMANIPSVTAHGILSYERTAKLAHNSVAMQPVQVLVPNRVEPRFFVGAYVVDEAAGKKLAALGFTLGVKVDSDLFFH